MTSAQRITQSSATNTLPTGAVQTSPTPAGPAMQSAKASSTDTREWSPRYRQDLEAIERLVSAPAPDHQAIAAAANAFVKTHQLAQVAAALVLTRGALLPTATSGMTSQGTHVAYAIDGIIEGHGNPVRYHDRLRELAPRVEAGELTADEARRKAARPFVTAVTSVFGTGSFVASEFANMHEGRGVVMHSHPSGIVAFTTQGTLAPDYHELSKRSWRDLASSVVIDGKGGMTVDPVEPKAAYDSLVRGLRYLGDLARYLAWEVER